MQLLGCLWIAACTQFCGMAAAILGKDPLPATDEVHALPGLSQRLCFRHFSGYLPTANPKRQLFYWYVEAMAAAEEKPVMLWLNGGPGCSSLLGMWTENGPFIAMANGSIALNPYSWNRAANILYIEQPAGVGFSFPAQNTNDTITAEDTHAALLAFLRGYGLLGRQLFVAGESYGGHFVPNIVEAILQHNIAEERKKNGGDSDLHVNIAGLLVGNPYTDWEHDFNANVPYARFHALCSPQEFAEAERVCGGNFARCFWPRPDVACPSACANAVSKATHNALSGYIDIYDIYADVCPLSGQSRIATQTSLLEKYRSGGMSPVSPVFPTCTDAFTETYLSRPEVQLAIHAKPVNRWMQCGIENMAHGEYEFNFQSMIPTYRRWFGEGGQQLQMLAYSGDADFIVNFLGTESWIESLQLPVLKHFRKWLGSDGQVAGYVTQYEGGLTFATVKGAGHMVPTDRPRHALDMVSAFLSSTPLDEIQPAPETRLLCSVVNRDVEAVPAGVATAPIPVSALPARMILGLMIMVSLLTIAVVARKKVWRALANIPAAADEPVAPYTRVA